MQSARKNFVLPTRGVYSVQHRTDMSQEDYSEFVDEVDPRTVEDLEQENIDLKQQTIH